MTYFNLHKNERVLCGLIIHEGQKQKALCFNRGNNVRQGKAFSHIRVVKQMSLLHTHEY